MDAAPGPIEQVRRHIGHAVREYLTGQPDPPRRLAAVDHGWFGPHSVAWTIHGDPAGLIGGVRALLLQTTHPLTMAGVADHSDYRNDPLGRLQRTGSFIGATTFGSAAEAESAVGTVRRIHERVHGTAPDGRPYAANDPHLLAWVHATEVDSFLRGFRRYGSTTITDVQADRYVDEMAVVAEAMGVERPPRSVAELRSELIAFRPELRAGRQCRECVRWLVFPASAPLLTRPPYAVIANAAISLLPRFVRRMLWLPMPPLAEPLAVRPAALALTRAFGWIMEPPVEHPTARAV